MAKKMALPKIGVNMTEAVVAQWLVKPGDRVKDGDPIIEAETDKSTQEIYATESGIVAKLLVSEGDTVPCYADIMVLVDEGEEYREEAAPAQTEAKAEQPAQQGVRRMQLPKIGVNMTEAVIAQWLVKPGDQVKDGDPIIEAETDKSTQEIYATESGIVAKLLVSEGDTVPCYADIMVLVDEGVTYVEEDAPKKAEQPAPKQAAPIQPKAVAPAAPVVKSGRVRISPLAKKIAKENGIDFHIIPPGKPGERIVKKDVLRFLKNGGAAAHAAEPAGGDLEILPMSPIRRTIASRMTKSVLEKPCVSLVTTADATVLLALRKKYKEKGVKVSMDAILAKMAAKALTIHRNINTILEEDGQLHVKRDVNVGIAVDTEKGLMVPVVKNADKKSLLEVAQDLSAMVEDAQAFRLSADNMAGGTFTITNLGMFGVEEFGPIINPPECCILGVGALKKEFVPDQAGQPKLTTTFKMTLVFDHRIVDGAPAAKFLRDLKELVEMPELLI